MFKAPQYPRLGFRPRWFATRVLLLHTGVCGHATAVDMGLSVTMDIVHRVELIITINPSLMAMRIGIRGRHIGRKAGHMAP